LLGGLLAAVALAAAGPAPPCPSLARAAGLPQVAGPALIGDVDGDGARDSVSVRAARAAPARCGLLLTVRARRSTLATRLVYEHPRGTVGDSLQGRPRPVPFLNGLYALDARPGLEIVATLEEGASDSFLRVYAVRRARLIALRIVPRAFDNVFSWGGFAAAYSGIDCAGGLVRDTSAVLATDGRHWLVERRFYRIGETAIIRGRTQRLRGSERVTNRFRRELMQRRPFPSCGGVAARRQV
jgi:hypothetical protein